jgi:hypothetical protein
MKNTFDWKTKNRKRTFFQEKFAATKKKTNFGPIRGVPKYGMEGEIEKSSTLEVYFSNQSYCPLYYASKVLLFSISPLRFFCFLVYLAKKTFFRVIRLLLIRDLGNRTGGLI